MTIDNYCKGCNTYEYYNSNDACYVKQNTDGSCPCTNCIVKPMCKLMCDAFTFYKGKINPVYYRDKPNH